MNLSKHRIHILLALLTIAIGCIGRAARADDLQSAVAELVKPAILDEGQSLAETTAFVRSRVPRVPRIHDQKEWETTSAQIRSDVLNKVIYRGAGAQWRDAMTNVEWLETIEGGPGYHIRKLRYEALPGLWIPALLYEPNALEEKVAVSLNVNGHDGKGKAAPYKQIRCINMAKRGMLALNVEWFGMGQLQGTDFAHGRMNQLDLCGTNGMAPFYLAMKRGLDVLLAHPNADPNRVAVAGLSGGGWQTIIISSLDTRVTLSNPVAGYSSFLTRLDHHSDLGDSEQTPVDLATVADYTHLTAIRAPRPTLLTYNLKDDCCFASDHALSPLMEAAQDAYLAFDKPANLQSHVNSDPGNHNFERDNREALYRMLAAYFGEDRDWPLTEIESQDELKTAEQLSVPLPTNESFHSLAVALAKELPHQVNVPDATAGSQWHKQRCQLLRSIISAHDYEANAENVRSDARSEIQATYWKIRLGDDWVVPVVELARGQASKTSLVVADEGRQTAVAAASSLLAEGRRVLLLDPFYLGECKIPQRGYLFALLVNTVGERPIGIQSSQIAAIAGWAKAKYGEKVHLHTVGPRTRIIASVACNLAADSISELCFSPGGAGGQGGSVGSPESLKDVIQKNMSVEQAPELFCFGLLEHFDFPELMQMAKVADVVKD